MLGYTRKQHYNASVPVLLYSDSAQNYALNNTETVLHIEGTFQKHLFRSATFTGTIWLEGMGDMTLVSAEHRIEGNHMDCTFVMGREDVSELSNLYFATLYWDEKKEQILLVIFDNERTNFTLDGFAAIGPYHAGDDPFGQQTPAAYFAGKPPVYDEWDLSDAFYDSEGEEFVFMQHSMQNTAASILADLGAVPSDSADDAYTLYVHFSGTALAYDTVTIENENTLKAVFRFRTISDYREGLAQLEAALEAFTAEAAKEEALDGRRCYTMQGKERVTSLEILPYPKQYRIELQVCIQN